MTVNMFHSHDSKYKSTETAAVSIAKLKQSFDLRVVNGKK